MKILLTESGEQLDGFLSISPEKLHEVADLGSVGELRACVNCDLGLLANLLVYLRRGGQAHLRFADAREVCRKFHRGDISLDDLSKLSPKLTMGDVSKFAEARGLVVRSKRFEGLEALVTIERP